MPPLLKSERKCLCCRGGTGPGSVLGAANPGDFVERNTCGASVAAGANCAFHVTFAPTTGSRSASLNFSGNGGGIQAVALSGTGTEVPGPALVTYSSLCPWQEKRTMS